MAPFKLFGLHILARGKVPPCFLRTTDQPAADYLLRIRTKLAQS